MTQPEPGREPLDTSGLDGWVRDEFAGMADGELSIVGSVGQFLSNLLAIGTGSAAGFQAALAVRDLADWRPHGSPAGDVVEALRRGELSPDEADAQLAKLGLSAEAAALSVRLATTLLPAAELLEAARRGILDRSDVEERLTRHGFDVGDASLLLALGRRLVGEGDALEFARRGLVDEDGLIDRLAAQGYSDSDAQHLSQLRWVVPGAQDTIRMLVREVFDPGQRERLGLDADYPVAADEQLSRAGVSPEDGRNYWAAHWELPSITESYRMYWRSLIDESDLGAILRAQDVLPRFRQPLIDAAYRVPTRVDVRRMHAAGIIGADEAERYYRDMGYSPEVARHMRELMVALNAAASEREQDEVRELTASELRRLWSGHVIDSGTYQDGLISLGYLANDAASIVSLAELGRAEDLRDDEIEVVRARWRARMLSREQAVEELDALDLPAAESERLLADLEREDRARVTLPPRGNVEDMLERGIITGDQYLEYLAHQGWPEVWAERRLVAITQASQERATQLAAAEEHRQASAEARLRKALTPAQITRAFRRGLIERGVAEAWLAESGYAPDQARLLLDSAVASVPRSLLKELLEEGVIDAGYAARELRAAGYDARDTDLILGLLTGDYTALPDDAALPDTHAPTVEAAERHLVDALAVVADTDATAAGAEDVFEVASSSRRPPSTGEAPAASSPPPGAQEDDDDV